MWPQVRSGEAREPSHPHPSSSIVGGEYCWIKEEKGINPTFYMRRQTDPAFLHYERKQCELFSCVQDRTFEPGNVRKVVSGEEVFVISDRWRYFEEKRGLIHNRCRGESNNKVTPFSRDCDGVYEVGDKRMKIEAEDARDGSLTSRTSFPLKKLTNKSSFLNYDSDDKTESASSPKITSAFSLSLGASSLTLPNEHQELKELLSKDALVGKAGALNKEERHLELAVQPYDLIPEKPRFKQEDSLAGHRSVIQRSASSEFKRHPREPQNNNSVGIHVLHPKFSAQKTLVPVTEPVHRDVFPTQCDFVLPHTKELKQEKTHTSNFGDCTIESPRLPQEFDKVKTIEKLFIPARFPGYVAGTLRSGRSSEALLGNNRSTELRSQRFSGYQPQGVLGRPSVSFARIRKSKQAESADEDILLDMMKRGLPSSLSTTSACHRLPIVCSYAENKAQPTETNTRKRLRESEDKIKLPSRVQKFPLENFRKFKMTDETGQLNSHDDTSTYKIYSSSASEASGLANVVDRDQRPTVPDKGDREKPQPASSARLFITPPPLLFRDVKLDMPFESNSIEPIIKIPNSFMDFDYGSINHVTEGRGNYSSKSDGDRFTLTNIAADITQNYRGMDDLSREKTVTEGISKSSELESKKVANVVQPLKKRVLSFETKANQTATFPVVTKEEPLSEGSHCLTHKKEDKKTAKAEKSIGLLFRTQHAEENVFQVAIENRLSTKDFGQSSLKMAESKTGTWQSSFEKAFGFPYTQDGIRMQETGDCSKKEVSSLNALSAEDSRDQGTSQIDRKPIVASILDEIHARAVGRSESPRSNSDGLEETHYGHDNSAEKGSSTTKHNLPPGDDHLYNASSDSEECSTHTDTSEGSDNAVTRSCESFERKYQCTVCGRGFSRSNTLITHTRIHTGDRPYICDLCGRAFRQLGNLTRHKLTHANVKPHTCPKCKKCFSRTSNLHTHMRTHTNYKPFVCEFCGKGFHQKVDMKIHRYTHTGEKPHKCSKCGRGFKQLTHLKYHMRTHSDVRMYKCEYCGKGFNQKGNLQAHIYGHTGNRPYKCDICGKGFTLTSTLNTHKRTHAPTKPFKCDYCDKAFYQKNALKTHYISSHPYTDGVCLL